LLFYKVTRGMTSASFLAMMQHGTRYFNASHGPETDVLGEQSNGHFAHDTNVDFPKFAATCINDRFHRRVAAL
jgi:hypothetical protein